MIPPQPISTLFPYTTLFRSLNSAQVSLPDWKSRRSPSLGPRFGIHTSHRFFGKPLPRDRKSTRLNSSHTVISYAVFCLKKKKKKKQKVKTSTNRTTETQSAT